MTWLQTIAAWLAATGVGDVIGFFASIASFGGAWAAFLQARKAKRAALHAEHAARQAQRQLAELDTIASISAAIQRLQSLKALQRDGRWDTALERYASQRLELIAIRERDRELMPEEQASIQSVIFLLSELEAKIERVVAGEGSAEVGSLNQLVAAEIDRLQILLQRKYARVVETQHGR